MEDDLEEDQVGSETVVRGDGDTWVEEKKIQMRVGVEGRE